MINLPVKKLGSFTGNEEKDRELGSWMDAAGVVLSPPASRGKEGRAGKLCDPLKRAANLN